MLVSWLVRRGRVFLRIFFGLVPFGVKYRGGLLNGGWVKEKGVFTYFFAFGFLGSDDDLFCCLTHFDQFALRL